MKKGSKIAREKAASKRKQRELKIRQEKAARVSREEGQGLRKRLSEAKNFPVSECVISEGWRERGLAHILIARDAGDGTLLVGGYYLDTFCVGMKDTAVIQKVEPEQYRDNVKKNIFNDPVVFENIDVENIKYLIEETIFNAEKYGFTPPKRWIESKKVLFGIEKKEFDFKYGKDGKPCLILRDNDNYRLAKDKLEKNFKVGDYVILDETDKGSS